jgi:hypothetical protein
MLRKLIQLQKESNAFSHIEDLHTHPENNINVKGDCLGGMAGRGRVKEQHDGG